jgi:[ribosomal protein S18]-alanine N-acetyltransferase
MAPYFTRRMSDGDLRQVLELEERLFSDPWNRPMYEEELRDHDAFVLADPETGEVAGYFCGRRLADEYEITNVGVKPELQRRGLAREMLGRMIGMLHRDGVRYFFLEVRESNTPARGLYNSFGFEVLQKRRNYYRDPVEDALLMRLDAGEPPNDFARCEDEPC